MATWSDPAAISELASRALPIWLVWQVKAAVFLFVVIALTVVALRHSSASTRHMYLTTGLAGLLAIPAASLVLPRWDLPLFSPQEATPLTAYNRTTRLPDGAARLAREFLDSKSYESDGTLDEPQGSVRSRLVTPPIILDGRLTTAILGGWILGAILFAVRLTWAQWRLAALWRMSDVLVDGVAFDLVAQTARELGVRRHVALIASSVRPVPMTWGIFRPVILLPAQALAWPAERLRLVLAHELSHVRRCDSLIDLFARIVCLVLWMNPLVWWVLSRMRVEREQACDNAALGLAKQATQYAEALLAVVRDVSFRRFASEGALSISHSRFIEVRLRALLDESRNRGAVTWRNLASGLATLLALLMPLTMFHPVAGAESTDLPGESPAGSPPVTTKSSPSEPQAASDDRKEANKEPGSTTGPRVPPADAGDDAKTTPAGKLPPAIKQDRVFKAAGIAEVRWIDPVGKKVWITLGDAAGLKPGTRFNVYKIVQNKFDLTDKHIKGSIEVARILAVNLSEARIVDEDLGHPMEKGDLVYSPQWRPKRPEIWSVGGKVVDRAGNPVEGATITASDRMTGREFPLPDGRAIVTDKDGRFAIEDLPYTQISLTALIEYAVGDADRTIQFPSIVHVKPGQTNVRIVLDPRRHRIPAKLVKPVVIPMTGSR